MLLPSLSMVFDGFGPLVKRCDGFDGSLWSNGDDDDDGYPRHCDDHHDCMVERATRGENDRPLNAANVHIDDDDDIWQ